MEYSIDSPVWRDSWSSCKTVYAISCGISLNILDSNLFWIRSPITSNWAAIFMSKNIPSPFFLQNSSKKITQTMPVFHAHFSSVFFSPSLPRGLLLPFLSFTSQCRRDFTFLWLLQRSNWYGGRWCLFRLLRHRTVVPPVTASSHSSKKKVEGDWEPTLFRFQWLFPKNVCCIFASTYFLQGIYVFFAFGAAFKKVTLMAKKTFKVYTVCSEVVIMICICCIKYCPFQ